MPEINRPDGNVVYEVQGSGPPLVILRGLARSVSHWLGYEKQLARHFTVVTLDLCGVGKTTRPWGLTMSIEHMADDVVAVIEAAGFEKAHILGVSLGGMVTLAAGLRHPERCTSLITVNTSIGGTGVMRLTPGAIKLILRAIGRSDYSMQEAFVDALVGPGCPKERKVEITKSYHEIAEAEGLYGQTAARQLLAAGRFLPKRRLKSLAVPTMIVYGTDDLFVPNLNSRKLAQYIPHATLVPIHGGGHELTLDKPDELEAVVRDWVARQ